MKVAYGYTVRDKDDDFISVAEESSRISALCLAPGRWLVDYYPICMSHSSVDPTIALLLLLWGIYMTCHANRCFAVRFLPFAGFKRQALEWKKRLEYLSEVPHQWVKAQIVCPPRSCP